MNIMLVDDEITMTNILQETVNWGRLGIGKVYVAYNAAEARTLLKNHHIHITLCDIEMAKESGLELIKWIQDFYPEIVNIILTGFPDFHYARSAISLGVYEYLLKPVEYDELENTIEKAVKKMEKEQIIKPSAQVKQHKDDLSAIAKVKQYLEQHYSEAITRNDIESLVHLNRDYINREFKQATGYSLMEYIQYYRILVAKSLLGETEHSISEISIRTGYDSPAYFSKIFKKWMGLTPIEYRNIKRKSKKSDFLYN